MGNTSSNDHDTFEHQSPEQTSDTPRGHSSSDNSSDILLAFDSSTDNTVDTALLPYQLMTDNQRRNYFGLSVSKLGNNADSCPHLFFPISNTDQTYSRDQVFALLQRAKSYLNARSIKPGSPVLALDRRTGDRSKTPQTVADLFPAVMYSYSSRLQCLPGMEDTENFVVSKTDVKGAKPFVSNVARSRNRWLDPVAQRRLAIQDRAKIQRAIAFAYDNGLVPVLATFTIPHHWDNLDQLRAVLTDVRREIFRKSTGEWLANAIGLRYYINDFEVTITEDGGFHPHCHAILLLDRNLARRLDEKTFDVKPAVVAQIELMLQQQKLQKKQQKQRQKATEKPKKINKKGTNREKHEYVTQEQHHAPFGEMHTCCDDAAGVSRKPAIGGDDLAHVGVSTGKNAGRLGAKRSDDHSHFDDSSHDTAKVSPPDSTDGSVHFALLEPPKVSLPDSRSHFPQDESQPQKRAYYHDPELFTDEVRFRADFLRRLNDPRSKLFTSPEEQQAVVDANLYPFEYLIRRRWFQLLVNAFNKLSPDKKIRGYDPQHYKSAILFHGFVLSREKVKDDDQMALDFNPPDIADFDDVDEESFAFLQPSTLNYNKRRNGKVTHCQDGDYLAEILTVADNSQMDGSSASGESASGEARAQSSGDNLPSDDVNHVRYGVDSELASDPLKNSTIPFDLLRSVSAHNIDMFNEYAISTKGWHKIQFSPGLQADIDAYFLANPDKDPANQKPALSCEQVLQLDEQAYYYFLNSNLIPELLERARHGFDSAYKWAKEEHGITILPPKNSNSPPDKTASPTP